MMLTSKWEYSVLHNDYMYMYVPAVVLIVYVTHAMIITATARCDKQSVMVGMSFMFVLLKL